MARDRATVMKEGLAACRKPPHARGDITALLSELEDHRLMGIHARLVDGSTKKLAVGYMKGDTKEIDFTPNDARQKYVQEQCPDWYANMDNADAATGPLLDRLRQQALAFMKKFYPDCISDVVADQSNMYFTCPKDNIASFSEFLVSSMSGGAVNEKNAKTFWESNDSLAMRNILNNRRKVHGGYVDWVKEVDDMYATYISDGGASFSYKVTDHTDANRTMYECLMYVYAKSFDQHVKRDPRGYEGQSYEKASENALTVGGRWLDDLIAGNVPKDFEKTKKGIPMWKRQLPLILKEDSDMYNEIIELMAPLSTGMEWVKEIPEYRRKGRHAGGVDKNKRHQWIGWTNIDDVMAFLNSRDTINKTGGAGYKSQGAMVCYPLLVELVVLKMTRLHINWNDAKRMGEQDDGKEHCLARCAHVANLFVPKAILFSNPACITFNRLRRCIQMIHNCQSTTGLKGPNTTLLLFNNWLYCRKAKAGGSQNLQGIEEPWSTFENAMHKVLLGEEGSAWYWGATVGQKIAKPHISSGNKVMRFRMMAAGEDMFTMSVSTASKPWD